MPIGGVGSNSKGKGPEHPKTHPERIGYSNRVGPFKLVTLTYNRGLELIH